MTTTATFSSPDATQIDIPPSGGNGYDIVPCTANFAVHDATIVGMSALSLPNGQTYTFKYDAIWGLVNEIDYPDGGWVKYTWKMSDTNNELATFNAKQSNTGFPPLTGYCDYRYQTPVVATRSVGYSPGSAASLTQTFTYDTVWNPVTETWTAPSSGITVGDERVWQSKTTKVSTVNTLPNNTTETSQTVYQYGSVMQSLQPDSQGQMPAQLAVESQVAYSDWGGTTPLKTEYKAWYDQFDIAADTTVLSNNLGTQAIYCYVGGDPFSLVQEVDQYNTLTSRTLYAQSATSLPSSCSPTTAPKSTVYGYYGTFGLPNQIVTYAAGTRIAETDAYYDGFSVLNPPYNTNTIPATPPAATPVAVGATVSASIHDETNYGVSSTKMRGNPTQVVRWANVGTSPTTTFTYDQTGQVRTKNDACGNTACSDMTGTNHKTTYAYADSFTTLSDAANQSFASPMATNAYLTTITDAFGHETSFTYDYYNGQLTSSEDVSNGVTTKYVYNDPLNRLKTTLLPDNGQTTISYCDPPEAPCKTIPTVTTSELISTGSYRATTASLDGMGHVTSTKLESPQEGPHYTNVNYDGMGQPYQTWNPYVSTSDTTYGASVQTYDGLGRKVQLQNQDSTSSSWCYSASRSGCPGILASGYPSAFPPESWVDSYDELGNHHQDLSDGFGRLIAVVEPNGTSAAPTMETDYAYDLLGNLWSVQQWGGAPDIAGARSRSFTYDSLSRLLCSSNPENSYASCPTSATSPAVPGTTSYSYDANGNLATKTDSRGVTTSYTYDSLNRVVAKSYSDGTNSACYRYDVAAKTGTTQYLVGRLSAEWTQAGPCPATTTTQIPSTVSTAQAFMKYDPVGRLVSELYCTPQSCNYTNGVSAIYDLAGDTTSLTYPDGRVVSQVFDSVARLSSVNSNWNGTGTPYLAVNTYDAFDHPISWTMGGTVPTTATTTYNNRVELTSLGYAQGSNPALWGKNYKWTNNSNLLTATDSVTQVVRQFGYDTLNRLTYAQDLAGAGGGSGQATNSSDETQANVLEDSQALGTPGWGGRNVNYTSNVIAAPDGSMTAGKVVSTTGSDSWATDEVLNWALYDGQPLTSTVWLRTPSATPITTNIYIVAQTDTGPGNTPQNNNIGPTSVTLTQAWKQFQVSGTAPNGLVALILQIGGAQTFTSGEEIDVWGAELQQNSTSTSVTNFLPYSQQWNAVSWTALSGMAVTANSTSSSLFAAPDGTSTGFQATSSSANSLVTDQVTNPSQFSGQTVTASVYLRVPSGSQNVALYLLNFTSAGENGSCYVSATVTTSWQRFTIPCTNLANLTGLSLQIGGQPGMTSGQVIDVWGAQVEVASTTNQYVATLDSPVTVTADSTNILPSSSQVSGQGWLVYSGTVAANSSAITAPDGSNTADEFTATSGSTAGYMYDRVSNPSQYDGATVTGSIYLCAANTAQSLTINIGNINASGTTIISTLNASVTTTWQRFDLPSGTNKNGLTLLYLSLGSSSNSQFTSTNPIYIWGAQMEMGSSPGAVNQTNNTTSGTGGSTLATNGLNETYVYDGFGNMLSAGNYNFVQSYTASNQLSGWNYDASGNLLIDGFNTGYAYDAEGRVSGEGQYVVGSPNYTFNAATTYVYDANGDRVAKTGSSATDYISFGGRQLARLSGGQWTDLIYGVGGLLAEVQGTQAGTPVYRMVDHIGSVVGTLNSSGALLSSLDYAPFGQVFAGGTADPYVFTGKERDTESGNDYFESRYYGSSMGRFLSPDDPFMGQDEKDPQSWNLYSYVRNNPLTNVDPDGHDCVLQTRTSSTTETVTVSSGNCDKVQAGDGQSKTYIAGTVDTSSIKGDGSGGITFGYTPYSGGGGVADISSAPTPDRPGLAYGYNQGGYGVLGTAGATVNPIAGVVMGAVGLAAMGGMFAADASPLATGIANAGRFAVQTLKNLDGSSKPAARETLHEAGFKQKGVSKGGYETWVHPDGSKVTLRPDGGVVRSFPDSAYGVGWRADPNGNMARPHSYTEEKVN